MSGTGRSARRQPGAVRAELVAAAERVFVDLGYHGASLRQIATRAGTTQAVLYRYFPSKATLFEESVVKPFFDVLAKLVDGWISNTEGDLRTEDLIAHFTIELYDFAHDRSGSLMALLAADAHGDEELEAPRHFFQAGMDRLLEQVRADKDLRGWGDIDYEVAAPITIALIVASALLGSWLFPAGSARPGRDRLLSEMIRYEIRAITGNSVEGSTLVARDSLR